MTIIFQCDSLKSRTSSKWTEFSTFDRGSCSSFFPSNAKQRSLMSRNTRIACKNIEAAFKLEKYQAYEDMTSLSKLMLRVRTKHNNNFFPLSRKVFPMNSVTNPSSLPTVFTLYTLTSVCIFSILFSLHFL